MKPSHWISSFGLEPHPEGGYFRRIYTAPTTHRTPSGERQLATSIYYLLDRAQPLGRMHRNRSDILHFFLDGGPLEYVLLDAGGALRHERMAAEQGRFLLVPGGCWKASRLVDGASHALIAEVVTPGFDYADHEFLSEERLLREHPRHFEVLKPFLTTTL